MAVLAFSLWVAAEFSDIVRGALESVPLVQKRIGLGPGLKQSTTFALCFVTPSCAIGITSNY